jgi:hypothetical protein
MISCVFIQTNEPMLKVHEFMCISKMVFITGVEFRHPNFSIKEGTIHLVFILFLILLCCKNSY